MDDFWFLKIANIFLSSLFLLGAWCVRKVIGVWLNPVSIFLLYWCFYTAFPLTVAFEVPVSPFAIMYILSFCLLFSLPSLFFRWPVAFECNKRKPLAAHYFDTPLMHFSLYAFSGFSMLMVFLGVLQQGISVNQILNNPLAVGGEYAGKRYAGEIVLSIYSQLGLQCSYYVVFLGGLIYGSRNNVKRKKKLLVVVFFPALLVMFLQSSKGLFFFSMFLFFGGILVARIYNKNFNLISYSDARSLLRYGVLVFPVIIASFMSRGIYQISEFSLIVNRLRFYLITYSSVHLPAFSDWFSERYLGESLMQYRQEELTMGFYSFMSFFRLLGDDRSIPMGTYDEFYTYGDYVKGNLYTVFRGLITDFGLLGSLIFALLLGTVCCFFYWCLLVKRNSAFLITFFVYFVAVSYQTYIISSLMWVTIPFVFLVQWFMLYFLMRIRLHSRVGI